MDTRPIEAAWNFMLVCGEVVYIEETGYREDVKERWRWLRWSLR
jgi:hypothetical protein